MPILIDNERLDMISPLIDALKNAHLIYDMNFKRLPASKRVSAMGRAVLRKMKVMQFPTILLLSITDRCQCKCRHCGVMRRPDFLPENSAFEEMDFAVLRTVLREFRRLGGVKVFFFGGEPLLRKDLVDLVFEATRLGLSSTLSTNGILFTEPIAKQLVKAGLCAVEVSLDSADPEKFAQLRHHTGIFEKVRNAVNTAHKLHLPVSIATYAYRENLLHGGLGQVVELAHSWKVRSVRILEPIAVGNWEDALQERLKPNEWASLSDHLIPGFVHSENQGRGFGHCSALDGDLVYITPSGVAYPCCYLPISMGNIGQESIETIFARLTDLSSYRGKINGCPANDPEFCKKFDTNGVCSSCSGESKNETE